MDQMREELYGAQQLMIGPEPRVKLCALVVDHSVLVAVSQSLQTHARSLHVGEETFESSAVFGVDPAGEIYVEPTVSPGTHPFHGFGADFATPQHQGEETLRSSRKCYLASRHEKTLRAVRHALDRRLRDFLGSDTN